MQLPPRQVDWSSSKAWARNTTIAIEKYFLRKIGSGESGPLYDAMLDILGIGKLKKTTETV